jgi:hypothetical protein
MIMTTDTKILSIDEIYEEILESYFRGELTEGEWMMSPNQVVKTFETECLKHGHRVADYTLYNQGLIDECECHLDKLRTKFI